MDPSPQELPPVVKVWNRALTAEEVKEEYEAQLLADSITVGPAQDCPENDSE